MDKNFRSVYIHVPFCAKKCRYCAFNSYADKFSLASAYFDAVSRQISALEKDKTDTVYIGGGTTSAGDKKYITAILDEIYSHFDVQKNAEITVEANPNTKITEEQYAMLVKEFSTDKNLRLESERFIQERQNKDRNKASVSIDGYDKKEPEKTVADDVIKTVIPEDVRPKFKPVGKIDLDKLNRKVVRM